MKKFVICSLVCVDVFGTDVDRFRDYDTYGIQLTVANACPGSIALTGEDVRMFVNQNSDSSKAVQAYQKLNLDIAFKKNSKKIGLIEVKHGESDNITFNVSTSPAFSFHCTSAQGLLYKLYSAKMGGGAEYYLVVAKDQLSLSLSRPIDSVAQSYAEVDSSDSEE